MNGDGTGNKSGVTTAAFLNALKAQTGADYIMPVSRVLSVRPDGGGARARLTCPLFLPGGTGIFGTNAFGEADYDDGLKPQFPLYRDSAVLRIKWYNGAMDWWRECSPSAGSAAHFCGVASYGYAASGTACAVGGCAPAFCVR